MRKFLLLLSIIISVSAFPVYADGKGENGNIKFDPPKKDDTLLGPRLPVLSPVMGKYVEGGVFIFSHADGMASVTAEDEDGLTIFSTIGNLGEGIFVPLSNVCGSVTLTVVYDTVIYTAEI